MATDAERPGPTQGQRANTVGKFYHMSRSQFSSPEEYARARDEAYQRWRDGMRTADDYNREARELMQNYGQGDQFQSYNERTALHTIIQDSQSKGIQLAPDVQQSLGAANMSQLNEVMDALRGGRGQRRPGQRPGRAGATPSSGDNVQVQRMFGSRGTKFASKTLWRKDGQRIDAENPNPGQRPGQIHFQDGNAKYLYDPATNSFIGAPNSVNNMLSRPDVQSAISRGFQYLGE